MSDNLIYSSAPVALVETVNLYNLESSLADTIPFWNHVKLEIQWLRESSAQVRLVHRGAHILNLSEWCDTRQFLGCADPAHTAAIAACGATHVTPDSELVVQIDIEVVDTPYSRRPEEDSSIFMTPAYRKIRHALSKSGPWYTSKPDLDEWSQATEDQRRAMLLELKRFTGEPKLVHKQEAIWTSQGHGIKNDRAFRQKIKELQNHLMPNNADANGDFGDARGEEG